MVLSVTVIHNTVDYVHFFSGILFISIDKISQNIVAHIIVEHML